MNIFTISETYHNIAPQKACTFYKLTQAVHRVQIFLHLPGTGHNNFLNFMTIRYSKYGNIILNVIT